MDAKARSVLSHRSIGHHCTDRMDHSIDRNDREPRDRRIDHSINLPRSIEPIVNFETDPSIDHSIDLPRSIEAGREPRRETMEKRRRSMDDVDTPLRHSLPGP